MEYRKCVAHVCIFSGHVLDMFVFLDIFWTCFGHLLDMFGTYVGCVWDMFEICLGYVWDVFETRVGRQIN